MITKIDIDQADETKVWNIYVNDTLIKTGGCHVPITAVDKVKFALETT
ncbi:hypothetical protein ACFWF7_08835 [Nocardia sp. NPDC060256]